MQSEDLARPVIIVSSLLDDKDLYEIYTYSDNVVVMPLDGKQTQEGDAALAALNDPAGVARKLLYNEEGGFDPTAVARLDHMVRNLPKMIEARAQEIAGKGKVDDMKEKRNAQGEIINTGDTTKNQMETQLRQILSVPGLHS